MLVHPQASIKIFTLTHEAASIHFCVTHDASTRNNFTPTFHPEFFALSWPGCDWNLKILFMKDRKSKWILTRGQWPCRASEQAGWLMCSRQPLHNLLRPLERKSCIPSVKYSSGLGVLKSSWTEIDSTPTPHSSDLAHSQKCNHC